MIYMPLVSLTLHKQISHIYYRVIRKSFWWSIASRDTSELPKGIISIVGLESSLARTRRYMQRGTLSRPATSFTNLSLIRFSDCRLFFTKGDYWTLSANDDGYPQSSEILWRLVCDWIPFLDNSQCLFYDYCRFQVVFCYTFFFTFEYFSSAISRKFCLAFLVWCVYSV